MRREHIKPVMLTLLLAMSLGLLWRMHRLEQNIDKAHADVNEALVHRHHAIARLELQMVMGRCNLRDDGLSSVERDPCRLVCWSSHTDEQFWDERLDELVCQELR